MHHSLALAVMPYCLLIYKGVEYEFFTTNFIKKFEWLDFTWAQLQKIIVLIPLRSRGGD